VLKAAHAIALYLVFSLKPKLCTL